MNVLLIDDERLARNELRRLLTPFPEVVIVGEAGSADEAANLLPCLQPDLLFLDIQMPGQNVFEWLASLDRAPHVIFTTAYDQYAVRAFDANALDYLLKPVESARLAQALQKVLAATTACPPNTNLLRLDEQVFVREGERCWFVKLADIRLLESEGNYTRLYFNGERPLIPRSLNQLAERLDAQVFFRASRKHLINLRWIERLEPSVNGGFTVCIQDCYEIEISRRQAQAFRQRKSL